MEVREDRCPLLLVLETAAALTCSSVGISAGNVEEVAQEDTSTVMAEVGILVGTLEEDILWAYWRIQGCVHIRRLQEYGHVGGV